MYQITKSIAGVIAALSPQVDTADVSLEAASLRSAQFDRIQKTVVREAGEGELRQFTAEFRSSEQNPLLLARAPQIARNLRDGERRAADQVDQERTPDTEQEVSTVGSIQDEDSQTDFSATDNNFYLGKKIPTLLLQKWEGTESLRNVQSHVARLDLKGAYLLNIMEPWCGPCRQKLPKVLEVAKKYEAAGLKVMNLMSDYTHPHAQEIIARYPDLTFGRASKDFLQQLGVTSWPTTAVTVNGKLTYINSSFGSAADFEPAVKKALEQVNPKRALLSR